VHDLTNSLGNGHNELINFKRSSKIVFISVSQAQNPYSLSSYTPAPLMGQSAVPGSMLGPATTGPVSTVNYDMTASNPLMPPSYGQTQPPTYGPTQPSNYGQPQPSNYGQSQPSTYGYGNFSGIPYSTAQQANYPAQVSNPSLFQGTGLPNVGMGSSMSIPPPAKASVSPQVEGNL
jgi:hypothetical protein